MEPINIIFTEERKHNSKVFLYYPDKNYELSYQELYKIATKMASGLIDNGVQKGDKILVVFDNTPESVIIAFSLMLIGAILVPVEPNIKTNILNYIIENSESKYAIDPQNRIKSIPNHIILLGYNDLINYEEDVKKIQSRNIQPTDSIVILYTSGSTGNPKGIIFTYESVIKNFTQYGNTMKFSHQTTFLQVMPLYHADGWNFTLLIPYLFNCSVVLTPKFNLNVCKDIFHIIKNYKCNILVAIPSILDSISLFSQRYDKKDIPILEYVITSSEKLCKTTKSTFEQIFKCNIYDLYGLTETQIISYYDDTFDWIEGSVGKLQKGVEVKFDVDGELLIKSPYLFERYCNNPTLTKKVYEGNWFRTGDIGKLSKDGYLFLLGRKSDIINKGGEKISPSDIDAIVKNIPFIKDCYTLGIKDDIYGQDILTIVVVSKDVQNENTIKYIKDICKSKLGNNYIPKEIFFIENFPINRSGKKDKVQIQELVKKMKFNH